MPKPDETATADPADFVYLPAPGPNLNLRIVVVGAGPVGCGAVDTMMSRGVEGAEFLFADAIDPDVRNHLSGKHLAIIVAGESDGTAIAGAVSRIARSMDILTIGAVMASSASDGVEVFRQAVGTLFIVPIRAGSDCSRVFAEDALYWGVRAITDTLTAPGLVGVDFSDVRTIIGVEGYAAMGTGEAVGDHRASVAAKAAISSHMLDAVAIRRANTALINVTGGPGMTLCDVDEAANLIRDGVADDANVVFGTNFDDGLNGKMRVTVIVTGLPAGSFIFDAENRSCF